jgi:hypothetical protein
MTAEEHHGIPHAFSSDTPSISSGYTGKSSANGRASSRASSRGTGRTAGTTGHLPAGAIDNTGKIIELDEEGDEFGAFGTTGYMFDMLQKSVRIVCLWWLLRFVTNDFRNCYPYYRNGRKKTDL